MTSPTTMRLVGLLVIVGVVAGCGGGTETRTNIVAGLVTTAAGEPLDNARVYVHQASGTVPFARTGVDGRFHVEVEGGEPVSIQVGKPQETTSADGEASWQLLGADATDVPVGAEDLHLVVADVPLDRVLRIRVMSPDGPVRDAKVGLWPRPIPTHGYSPDRTDEEGLTVQERLAATPVTVRVFRRAPWCGAYAPYLLPDTADEAEVHEIRLARDRRVEGRLVDEAGHPVAGLSVMPTSEHPGTALAWGDLSGLDGRFCVGVPDTWPSTTLVVGRRRPHDSTSGYPAAEIVLSGTGAAEEVVVTAPREALSVPTVEVDPRYGPESLRVIAAALEDGFLGEETKAVLLARPWSLEKFASDPKRSLRLADCVQASTLRDFHRKNAMNISPPVTLKLDVPVIVDEGAWLRHIRSVQSPRGWDHLDERFPGARAEIHLSAVGFSDHMDEAVLHIGRRRGGVVGAGHYYVLVLRGGQWVVVHHEMTWVS